MDVIRTLCSFGRPPTALGPLTGAAAMFLSLLAGHPASAQEEGGGDGPVPRVGLSQQAKAALDSAPETVTWEAIRGALGVTLEDGGNARAFVVVHALLIEDGEVTRDHTSDPVDILPGGVKFAPDVFLPEENLIPDDYQIVDTIGLGVVELGSDELMSDLVRDIILPMTEGGAALYIIATPPDGDREGSTRAFPIVMQLRQGGGGAGASG